MTKDLTIMQAFISMTYFLEDYYQKIKSDDLGSLLGDLSLLPNGSTADPAAWYDWLAAVGEAKSLTSLEAFNAMKRFLEFYCQNTYSPKIDAILEEMNNSFSCKDNESSCWSLWQQCVDDTLSGKNTPIMLTFV